MHSTSVYCHEQLNLESMKLTFFNKVVGLRRLSKTFAKSKATTIKTSVFDSLSVLSVSRMSQQKMTTLDE